jgi:hypothetical protein
MAILDGTDEYFAQLSWRITDHGGTAIIGTVVIRQYQLAVSIYICTVQIRQNTPISEIIDSKI